MDKAARAKQAWVELQILQHVKQALRVTLDWRTGTVGLDRKLSSVRFMVESFQRHLERLMVLEEEGGYLEVVREEKPNQFEKVAALRAEHDEFRHELRRIVPALESDVNMDEGRFVRLCEELGALLHKIDEHDHNETDLLMEVVCTDEGGEGG